MLEALLTLLVDTGRQNRYLARQVFAATSTMQGTSEYDPDIPIPSAWQQLVQAVLGAASAVLARHAPSTYLPSYEGESVANPHLEKDQEKEGKEEERKGGEGEKEEVYTIEMELRRTRVSHALQCAR